MTIEEKNLLKSLKKEYNKIKKENTKKAWTYHKNFISRIFESDKAYMELIDNDIDFTTEAQELVNEYVKDNNLGKKAIEDYILSLKIYISRNENRTKFLFSFPVIFTLLLIFDKIEVLDKILTPPYNIALLTVTGILMFFTLVERTNLIEYKHSMEEIILLLEAKLLEDN